MRKEDAAIGRFSRVLVTNMNKLHNQMSFVWLNLFFVFPLPSFIIPLVFGALLVGQQLQHLHVVGVSGFKVPLPEQVRLLHVGWHRG